MATLKAKNAVGTLKNHQLATQPLRNILGSVGAPQTRQEKNIIASLAEAYGKMGQALPSPELAHNLNELYSQAISVADGARFALGQLVMEYTRLALEKKGLSLQRVTPDSQEKTVIAWSKAFHEADQDSTPALERGRELRFLALQIATKWIEVALNPAKKQ